MLNINKSSSDEAVSDEKYLNRIKPQIKTKFYVHVPVTVLIRYEVVWLMTFETHCDLVERRCSLTGRGQMDIPPRNPFYLCKTNLTVRAVSVLNFYNCRLCMMSSHLLPTCCRRYTTDVEFKSRDNDSDQEYKDEHSINSILQKLPENHDD